MCSISCGAPGSSSPSAQPGTGAVLIWARTTVVPEGVVGRFVGYDIKYNDVASKIMNGRGTPTNGLHALSSALPPMMFVKPGDVHFAKGGLELLALEGDESILSIPFSTTQPKQDNP
jgi:hypothetical protein